MAKIKTDGLEAMTRKQEEDLERSVAQIEQVYDEAKTAYKKQQQTLLDLESGIQHISSKVSKALPDRSPHIVDGQFKRQTTVAANDTVGTLENTRVKLKQISKQINEMEEKEVVKEAFNYVSTGAANGRPQSAKRFGYGGSSNTVSSQF